MRDDSAQQKLSTNSSGAQVDSSAKTGLVIVADDYPDMADVLAELIEGETCYRVLAVADGRRACEAALLEKPVALLLDVEMPVMGGIEAARALRAHFGATCPMLLAMSGRAVDDAKASGQFDQTFVKPLNMQRLTSVLLAA